MGTARRRNPRSHRPLPARAAIVGALLAGAVAAAPQPAAAETEVGPVRVSGAVEFGGRTTWVEGDDSVFERYRDLDDGVIGGWDVILEDANLNYFLHTTGWNVGYDSQRYTVEVGRYAWWKLDGFYKELPVVFSNNASTLYGRPDDETLLLPSTLQASIAGAGGAGPQSAALESALLGAMPVDLEYRWLTGGGGGELQLTDSLLLRARYQIHDKKGTRPFRIPFGNPGGTFIQLPGPLNEKIHEVRAGADYARDAYSISFDYIGSIFENDLRSLTASNPLVAADVVGDSSRGRASQAPDNQAHQFLLSGSAALPLGMPNRLSSSFGYQLRIQDDPFLPQTVNTALAPLPPSRGSLDGRVDTFLGNVLFTARPADRLGFKARYRIYDFNNETDRVVLPEHVVNDEDLSTTPFASVHDDYQRQNAEAFLSYDLPCGFTPRLGAEWEYWRRDEGREVLNLHEYGPVLEMDWRMNSIAYVRADYKFLTREGSDYATFRHLEQVVGLNEALMEAPIQQSPLLRKYTQADRDTHVVEVSGTVMPTDITEFGLHGGFEHEDYEDTALGLTEAQRWNVGADVGWQIHPRVSFTAWYTYENQIWEQDQRWRPRNFGPMITVIDSPLNDWFSTTEDEYHTGGARLNVDLLPGRLDGEIAYIGHFGRTETRADGAAGFVPAPMTGNVSGGDAVNWPAIESNLNAFTASLNLHVLEGFTIRGQYRFEDFHIDDFTQVENPFQPGSNLDGAGTVSPSRDVFLGAEVDDYRAHIFALTAVVEF